MPKTTVVKVLFWVAACGGMISSHPVHAESRALVPFVSDEAELEEAQVSDTPVEGSRKVSPVSVRKPGAPKRPAAAKEDKKTAAKAAPAGKARSNAKAPQRRSERQPTAEYQRIRDGWHAPIPRAELAQVDAAELPPLVLAPVNGGERVSLTPDREDGGFSQEELLRAARVFTPAARAKAHPIAPRLLDLVYRAMRHFDAPLVHMVSGYRADRAGSRHTQGRAIDMVIPGVSNDELANYVRGFGYVGVGVYPKSGFVHLDVRDSSFFWIDESLPDERCRTQPVLIEEAKLADQAARDRGEGPNSFVPNNDREDRAAARAYQRRAQQRRTAAAGGDHVRSF
jgi:uncharacterized protein YcbK (DUF882 family)